MFALGSHGAIKLYLPHVSVGEVRYEQRVTAAARAAGLPVPAVYGVEEVNGRLGLVCERIGGPSLLEALRRNPFSYGRAGRILARLHARVHAVRLAAPHSQRERLRRALDRATALPAGVRGALARRLQGLPDAATLCHGDVHPLNVLLSPRGPVLIDWVDASRGHPAGDVARTVVLLTTSSPPAGRAVRWLLRGIRSRLCASYLRAYAAVNTRVAEQVAAWLPVVAGARMAECTPAQRQALLRYLPR